MKLKKILYIFLCCILMVSVFTVSVFATSQPSQTTSLTYGYYISPGTYVWDDVPNFNFFSDSITHYFKFSFRSNSIFFTEFSFRNTVQGTQLYFRYGDISPAVVIYNGLTSSFSWVSDVYKTIDVLDGFYIYDFLSYQFWVSNLTRVDSGYSSSLLDSFLGAFTFVGQWISGAVSRLTPMFWADSSLTFLGVLCISSLGLAVCFLIIGLIQRFLKFRG